MKTMAGKDGLRRGGGVTRKTKVGEALTVEDLVCLTTVLSLKKRPNVCAISTKQILAAN